MFCCNRLRLQQMLRCLLSLLKCLVVSNKMLKSNQNKDEKTRHKRDRVLLLWLGLYIPSTIIAQFQGMSTSTYIFPHPKLCWKKDKNPVKFPMLMAIAEIQLKRPPLTHPRNAYGEGDDIDNLQRSIIRWGGHTSPTAFTESV